MATFAKESTQTHKSVFEHGICGPTAKYYVNLVLYLAISYISSCIYVLLRMDFAPSVPVQVAILVIIGLSIFSVCTFPLGFRWMKTNKLSFPRSPMNDGFADKDW